MKRFFIALLFFLLFSAFLVELMLSDSGVVIIAFGEKQLLMSVWVALLLWSAASLLGYVILRLLLSVGKDKPRKESQSWWHKRSVKNQRRKFQETASRGFINYLEGHWEASVQQLTSVADKTDVPIVYYLTAAHAALELDDREKAQSLLMQAKKNQPEAALAFGVTQARFNIAKRQWEKALAVLLKLHSEAPRQTLVLRLLADVYQKLQDWTALQLLLPELRKRSVFSEQILNQLEREVYTKLFEELIQQATLIRSAAANLDGMADKVHRLQSLWKKAPSSVQNQPAIFQVYVKALIQLHAGKKAEVALKDAIDRQWDDQLVLLFGLMVTDQPSKRLEYAQKWLKIHPNNPSLLLTLGRLSLQVSDSTKAKHFFENSIQLHESREACIELAKLLVKMGDISNSNRYFQQAERINSHL